MKSVPKMNSKNMHFMQRDRMQALANEGASVMEWEYDEPSQRLTASQTQAAVIGVFALASECCRDLGSGCNPDEIQPSDAGVLPPKSSAIHTPVFAQLIDPTTREAAMPRLLHNSHERAVEESVHPSKRQRLT